MPASSPVEVSLVNKTTSSICISWSMLRGLVTTLILSIKNRTSTQERITSYQEPRSVSVLLSQYTNYCGFMSLAFQSSDRNYLKTPSAKAECVYTDYSASSASLLEASTQLKLLPSVGTEEVNLLLWPSVLVSVQSNNVDEVQNRWAQINSNVFRNSTY